MVSQTFKYQGARWTRVTAQSDEAYVMGVDLGQSQDPTAIVVLHHTKTPLDTWTVNQQARTTKQDVQERFDCVVAERVPLNTSYPDVVAYVGELLNRPMLHGRCELVIDESGVGRAVSDLFELGGLKPIRVAITAGVDATKTDRRRCWSVAKSVLISGVDACLNVGSLRFADELREREALREELQNFRRHVTNAGKATYQARSGAHDDLVLAVAIALWWCGERRKHQVRINGRTIEENERHMARVRQQRLSGREPTNIKRHSISEAELGKHKYWPPRPLFGGGK